MKGKIMSRVQVGSHGRLDVPSIRHLAQKNPEVFVNKVRDLIDEEKISWSALRDIKTLYYALCDVPVRVSVQDGMATRSVMSSAFPVLCGDLTAAAVNKAYEGVPTIGQDLVTEMDDPNQTTYVSAIHTLDKDIESVKEGEDYPEIGAMEEAVTIGHRPNGRIVRITKETIEQNQIGDITSRINALGEIAAEHIEEHTISKVTDQNDDVYAPNGTAEALYSTTARDRTGASGNLKISNSLSDETDLENVRALLAAMKNSRGKRMLIPMSRCILLVPDALVGTAWEIRTTTKSVGDAYNELEQWGTQGLYKPTLLSTPKLDDFSTTDWWIGDFKSQFVRKWKLRMEYVTMGENTQAYLNSRVAFQARIAWDCTVGATDYVYVVKSISTTA